MKFLFATLCLLAFALVLRVSAQCATPGFSCASSTTYNWCSSSESKTGLTCPFNTMCTGTSNNTLPCDVSNVVSTTRNYFCNPSQCALPNCRCALNTPPGNIANQQALQMVTLTFDDALNANTWPIVRQVLDYGHRNPNGCGIRVTWFDLPDTACDLLQQYLNKGHELAGHTYNHVGYPSFDEITAGSKAILQCANGRNATPLNGFRAPLLAYADWTWQALHSLGYLYESSSPEGVVQPESPSIGNKIWPYTFDYGYGSQCWSGKCSYEMRLPGLWSIPMNTLDETNQASPNYTRPIAVMDPPFTGQALQNLYYNNFLAHYNGNRAPFGIWLHPAWLMADLSRIDWLNGFLQQILAMPGVWVVSMQDVISYMKNPVTVAQSASSVPFFAGPAVCSNLPPPAPTGNPPTGNPTGNPPTSGPTPSKTPTGATPTGSTTKQPPTNTQTPTGNPTTQPTGTTGSSSSSSSSSTSQQPPTPTPSSPNNLGSGAEAIFPFASALIVAIYALL